MCSSAASSGRGPARGLALFLLAAAAALLVCAPRPAAAIGRGYASGNKDLPEVCSSEWQIVMCADVPLNATAELAACCSEHAPRPVTAAAAVAGAKAEADTAARLVKRPDLDLARGPYSQPPDWFFWHCIKKLEARVPSFRRDGDGETQAEVLPQPVPELTPDLIRQIKARALSSAPPEQRDLLASLTANATRASAAAAPAARRLLSGAPPAPRAFAHPGGYAGAAELAALQHRLQSGEALQAAARDNLLTGRWVPRNGGSRSRWSAPAGTPAEDYGGPYATEVVRVDIGGLTNNRSLCHPNYPAGADQLRCGHVSFVELDSAQAYKAAAAYAATRDERYAALAARILNAWATTNKEFGLARANGPLEAAWGCAAMARAAELLRATWPEGYTAADADTFVSWAKRVLLPNVNYFVDELSAYPSGFDKTKLMYGNWHASCADCYVALGVLADDRALYNKGRDLYRTTLDSFFKWGRGDYAANRTLGEATETLRDIYHTLFGIGSLMQAAETAWAQDEDAYSESDHILAAALETHARIINAHLDKDESELPPGFRFFESMPPPPKGCTWRWSVGTQKWASYNTTDGKKCTDLEDGLKYALGIKYLPTGFELGFNHFVGRLGMQLPETARLLARYPVDWFEFTWGLGTLTHADTARVLWRPGVREDNICPGGRAPLLPGVSLQAVLVPLPAHLRAGKSPAPGAVPVLPALQLPPIHVPGISVAAPAPRGAPPPGPAPAPAPSKAPPPRLAFPLPASKLPVPQLPGLVSRRPPPVKLGRGGASSAQAQAGRDAGRPEMARAKQVWSNLVSSLFIRHV
ncbi:hypothetical protein Rsub_11539 [Raphidocelis subcapitata]|uniref:Alginate lyase domain-containing protein n=1 Tax=Raphidocelis subcapitata TaxID=307507 RepID=A0A2V0PGF2_9CHLO|nr:hypothetical protein Rsub_11539 [Raphidocelis subcapitata]|eukprot:GBF98901.1 hypothetical protein Rsub_11539 [Raphidocelis subcapitata]